MIILIVVAGSWSPGKAAWLSSRESVTLGIYPRFCPVEKRGLRLVHEASVYETDFFFFLLSYFECWRLGKILDIRRWHCFIAAAGSTPLILHPGFIIGLTSDILLTWKYSNTQREASVIEYNTTVFLVL